MLNLLLLSAVHPNLLTNGDFSAGAKGFKSGYTLSNDVQTEGNYLVGHNPVDGHPGGANFTDHTDGKGLMLIVNGSLTANTAVWQETITVRPGHSYSFGLWGASWGKSGDGPVDTSPAKLVITINGEQIGEPFTLDAHDGAWVKFAAPWKSQSTKNAVIRIVDSNIDGGGNDFAIDDIVFHE